MAIINDVTKLRPELKDVSDNELERRMRQELISMPSSASFFLLHGCAYSGDCTLLAVLPIEFTMSTGVLLAFDAALKALLNDSRSLA
jgi:hypothetical protein